MGTDFACHQVPYDDPFGVPVNHDDIEHFGAWKHFHGAKADLSAERLVGPQQELLTGLAAGIKSAGDLGAAKRAVGEQSAVFTRERDALGDTLVDDIHADLGEAI